MGLLGDPVHHRQRANIEIKEDICFWLFFVNWLNGNTEWANDPDLELFTDSAGIWVSLGALVVASFCSVYQQQWIL